MPLDPTLLATARQRILSARTIIPHTDADGLASGAIALRARGDPAAKALLLGRGQNPYSPDTRLPDGPLAVLDLGVRPLDRESVLVDHHVPEGEPTGKQLVVSGHGEADVSTSVLMRRIFPDAPAWLAAVGAAGDYGDAGLRQPECAGVVKSHVKKLVPLINAPRRLPGLDAVRTALALLVESESPKAALADERIEELEHARNEYRAGYDAAVKTAPKVNDRVAVIRFRSPYQVHPLIAQTWSQRLAPRVVLAANDDYIPGHVNFAVRGGTEGQDLRQFLRDALPDATGEFAHGHSRATGGSLTFADFDRLLRALDV